jgi:RNase P/RNase MRP subunit p30
MKYWDYCVRSECDALGAAKTAKELGWEGIVVLSEEGGKFPAPSSGAKIRRGILVRPKSKEQLKKAVKKKRAECALIAVESRDDETNRAAVETPEVDILLPGSETKIDVVMAKLARESDVTIAFEFSALLHSSLEDRGRHFSQMLKNAGSVRKFRAPFVISSG